jgi:peroxiredoxin
MEEVMIANDYRVQGMGIIAISSNDAVKYHRIPFVNDRICFENNFEFPYLYDGDQTVAKAYQASCTPDFFYLTV